MRLLPRDPPNVLARSIAAARRSAFALLGACALLTSPAIGAPANALQSLRVDTPAALRHESYRLWDGRAPGSTGDTADDVPSLTIYRPAAQRGTSPAVVIAPGGGYVMLASGLEGSDPAAWFAARGVTAFVLTYRTGKAARLPTVLEDGARSIRFVRTHAKDFGIDPSRIAMMGFSAGGHLAASTAVYATAGDARSADEVERVSSRPDYLILGYPWLEGTIIAKDGTSQYCLFALEKQVPCLPEDYTRFVPTRSVTGKEPPTFIYHTTTDTLVSVAGAVRLYMALQEKGVPVEMHDFAQGEHGTGLGGSDPLLSIWPLLLENWLRAQGFFRP
ncbi:alpha/beta hydrolase [Caulobacter sp. FWC2]|uniref:alpha/beta hydrolase n=1 Tax=Caulobacter sp. FWC2 TaxID=69664 RepID=UPI000C157C9F|nr:alpha/beta hydrolase [Caulobacter sp. FWC2]PIB91595.1 alpha/beta hydrolase [Caulobacter sp. FWC2]